MLPPFLEEPIIPARTFVCYHVDMDEMTEITEFQKTQDRKKNL